MRIALISASLGCGGAERALVSLAGGFRSLGHDVAVVTYSVNVDDFFELPEGVPRIRADLGNVESVRWFDVPGNLVRLIRIRRALARAKPNVIVSFLDGTNELMLMATMFWRVSKVVSSQVDMREHAASNKRWHLLRRLLYPFADKVVLLDEGQAAWCKTRFRGWRTYAIPNPVPAVGSSSPRIVLPGGLARYVVAMGRLVHQKGFDLLLSAFAQLTKDFPEWGLIVLGEGLLRGELQHQIDDLGLRDRAFLPGVWRDPFSLMSECDMFVLSSRYEGMGLALAEAMACGLPAVSFDCRSGPSYIIRHGEDGLLVPVGDVEALAGAMAKLMADHELRTRMGREAKKIAARFGLDSVLAKWVELFEEIDS